MHSPQSERFSKANITFACPARLFRLILSVLQSAAETGAQQDVEEVIIGIFVRSEPPLRYIRVHVPPPSVEKKTASESVYVVPLKLRTAYATSKDMLTEVAWEKS